MRYSAVALLLSGLIFSAHGQDNNIAMSTDHADKAFKLQDYTNALALYQKSYALKQDPFVLYNIGVCQIKLGQYQQAYQSFSQVEQALEETGVATYNKGVALKKMGKLADALAVFEQVEKETKDDTIGVLATRQILVVKDSLGLPVERARKKKLGLTRKDDWFGSIGLSYGADDNVIAPGEETTSQTSDNYLETLGTVTYQSNIRSKDYWAADFTYYDSSYSEYADYDVSYWSVGAKRHFTLGEDNTHMGFVTLGYDKMSLASQEYMSTLRLDSGYHYTLDSNSRLSLRWVYKQNSADDSQFSYLEGDSHKLSLRWRQRHNATSYWTIRTTAWLEDKNDRDSDFGFTSFSAQRLGLDASHHWSFADLDVAIRAGYRDSQYADDNTSITYDENGENPQTTNLGTRSDFRWNAGVDLDYAISNRWSVSAELSYTDNSSSIENYDYSQMIMAAGVSYQF
ncbi:hypothetical protein C2869_19365 [Saccharobesus litoralis]|uniref:Uncharacterized protein n=1 Tax=Saccharobesus litoralis TaxID=2172099 RepID=A0A2S0VW78_9ALTE|nr:tetratricopeptide repeat protein [Saccharobesus litoralis]AWB68433.1 hypothetical protein C2869_19365 [Saccharobesus litoralis]